MAIDPRYVSALNKLFRTQRVALLDDLRQALGTPSRTTIFRVLSAAGYHTSYSHAGRYYTLERIPRFDSQGLWRYRGIGFSAHGTLRRTVIHWVDTSPAGQTHGELEARLELRVQDTLRLLVRAQELSRQRFDDAYVYLSAQEKRAAAQWAQRRQLAPPAPGKLDPVRIIDVLVDVIQHPGGDAGAVARRLWRSGRRVTPGEVDAIFSRYDLKKTPRSRSRRWRH